MQNSCQWRPWFEPGLNTDCIVAKCQNQLVISERCSLHHWANCPIYIANHSEYPSYKQFFEHTRSPAVCPGLPTILSSWSSRFFRCSQYLPGKQWKTYAARRGCIGWFPGSTENWKKGLALSSIARLKFEDLSLPECSTKFYLQNSTWKGTPWYNINTYKQMIMLYTVYNKGIYDIIILFNVDIHTLSHVEKNM